MSHQLNVLAVPGSLRRESINKALANTLQSVAPEGMNITVFTLEDIPLYNNDVENEGFPAGVQAFRDAIAATDGIVFVTPEYNGSVSGVLKNAIDWASRGGLLALKPTTTMGGSPGSLGAGNANVHLRHILIHLNTRLLARPYSAIPRLSGMVENGVVTDEKTLGFVSKQLAAFKDWMELVDVNSTSN